MRNFHIFTFFQKMGGRLAILLMLALVFVKCNVYNLDCATGDPGCNQLAINVLLAQSITPTILIGDNGGNIYRSYDGYNWEGPTNLNGTGVTNLMFANGLFWATTQQTTPAPVYYSADGLNWTATNSGLSGASRLGGLAYGNGLFVCAGQGGGVHYSSNGIDWTTSSDPEAAAASFQGAELISFENGQFIGGEDAGGQFMYSSDGIDWSIGCSSTAIPTEITFFNGNYYTSDQGTINVFSTVGGVCPTVTAITGIQSMAKTDRLLIAAGNSETIYRSTDGSNWSTNLTAGGTAQLGTSAMGQSNMNIIAGASGVYYLSTNDGYNWNGPHVITGAGTLQASVIKPGIIF